MNELHQRGLPEKGWQSGDLADLPTQICRQNGSAGLKKVGKPLIEQNCQPKSAAKPARLARKRLAKW